MYQLLKFSYNWNNKLNCRYFTTLRLKNQKYQVYNKYRVFLNDVHLKDAEITNIKEIRLDEITPYMAGIDTGYNVMQTQAILTRMYPKCNWNTQQLYFMLLKTINPPTPAPDPLLF